MTLNAGDLRANLDTIEQIEKATLRMVVQAIYDFRNESDLVADIGEDITREALDRQGMPTIPISYSSRLTTKGRPICFNPNMRCDKRCL